MIDFPKFVAFETKAMTKRYLITTSILGMWGIVMGILFTQIFSGEISPASQGKYLFAIVFHLIHVVAMLAITFMNRFVARAYLNIIYYLFTAGILLYSGSLYLISTEELTNIILGFMGTLTPLGGLSLVIGWGVLLFTGVTYKHKKRAIHNS
jgi:uncharacterized membrane protein YgdD (TMEM256/DUF423 family)